MNFKLVLLWFLGLVSFAIICVFIFLLANQPIDSTIEEKPVAVLAWDDWPGMLPYWVAYEKGFFAAEGLDVKMAKVEDDRQLINKLLAGEIDFAADVDLVYLIKEQFRGNNLQIIGVTDSSSGADGVVAKKNISGVKGLKNKKVAVEAGSLSEKMLYYALDQYDLGLKDINIINLNATEAAVAFIQGMVDAAVTYEPSLSEAVSRGEGQIIFSSAQTPNLLIDTLVARKFYIDSHNKEIQSFLQAYLKAVDYIKANPDEAYGIGAQYLGVTKESFAQMISGLKIMGLDDNMAAFSFTAGYESLFGNAELTNNFLLEIGEISSPVNVDDFIRPEFIRKIKYNQ